MNRCAPGAWNERIYEAICVTCYLTWKPNLVNNLESPDDFIIK